MCVIHEMGEITTSSLVEKEMISFCSSSSWRERELKREHHLSEELEGMMLSLSLCFVTL